MFNGNLNCVKSNIEVGLDGYLRIHVYGTLDVGAFVYNI